MDTTGGQDWWVSVREPVLKAYVLKNDTLL